MYNLYNYIQNSMIFKQSILGISDAISQIQKIRVAEGLNGLFDATTVQQYTLAISGLNKQEAITLLQRQGLSTAQQAQILSSAGLLQTTQMLNASLVEEAVLNSKISGEKAEQILTELGVIEAKTGNLIVTKECTVAEVAQALATKGIVGADAEAILSQLGLATANTTTTVSFAGLTTAIKANTAAMVKWLVTNPVGWCILAVGAIYGLSKAYDAFTVSVEEANEAMNEAVSSYESTKSELESINSELEENQKQIDELLAKDKLTYAEKGQLEELQEITKELQLQQDIAERKAEKESRDVAEKTVDAYDKQYGKFDINEDEINKRLEEMDLADVTSIASSDDDITGNIAELLKYQKLLDETAQKLSKTNLSAEDAEWLGEDFQEYTDHIQEINDILDTNLSDLEEKRQNLEDGYKAAIEKQLSGQLLTTTEKDVISTYENIASVMKLIYQYIDPNSWNEMQVASIFDTEGIEVTKEELVEMAKAGELDENTIKGYTNLNNAINGMDLIGGTSAMQAFVDEIYASVDASEDATASAETLSDSFADIFNSAEFSEVKAELLELAKSGELTTATLTSTEEYNNLLSKTGLLAGDAKDKILDMLSAQDKLSAASQGLDNLKSAYEEFKDEEIGFVTAETLSSLPDAFKELKGFDLFSQIVGDPTSGTKKIQQAFDDIAKEYLVEQRTLTGLSRENMNSYIANIKQMGITNAEEVVNTVLTNLESTNTMIEQAEKEYIQCLNDGTAADLDHVQTVMAYNQKLASELGTSYQKDYETWCELLELKSEAYNKFVERIGGSYNSELDVIQNMMNNGKDMGASNIADALAAEAKVRDADYQVKKQSEILKIDMTPIDTNFGGGYSPKTGDDSKKDKKDEFSQTFNWVETLLDKLSKKTEKLKEKFEEAFTTKTAKTAFKDVTDQITDEIEANEKAAEYYDKKANGVKLSPEYKRLVDSGALKIEDITDEALAKQVELYQDYKDKAEACRDTIDDLRDSYAELADTFYSKPLEVRDNNIEEVTTQLELLDSMIENATSAKERENYAKQKESLYKKEYNSYVTAEETTAKYLKSAKSNINQKSDKALKGLTDKQKTTITNAVKNGVEITDAIIDMDSLTPEALKAIENYNSALRNNKQAASDAAQAEQDLAQSIRENKQVKIDSKQDEIDNLKAQYENLDENNWQGRNDNLDEQIKKTKTLYKLLIDQETDVVRKEQLRAELNKQIADLKEQQVKNIRTYWQNVGNLEGSIADERNSKQDYLEASGKDTVASRVENYNTTAFQSRKEAVAKLNEANTYDTNTAEYHSLMSEYWSLMAKASDAEYSVWKESVLGVYDSVIDEVTKKGDDLEKAIELDEAKGIEKDEYDYIALINQASAEIAVNQNKIEQLQQKQQQIIAEGGSIESTAYKDLQAQIEKCEDAIYDNQKAQIEYNNALDNLPLERLEKALELLEAIGDRYGSENDLKLKLGFELTEEDFQNELDNIDKQVANLDGQINEKWTDYLKAVAEGNMSKAEGLLKEYSELVTQKNEILLEKEDVKDEKRDYLYIKPLEDRLAKLEHKSDMLSGIGDLIPDDMKFDSDGNLTDLGRTAIAIDVSQLGNAREQLKAIGEEMSVVQELYEKGEYTLDERNEKLNDLRNRAMDIAKSQMDSMNSLKDMATSMAENELDALNNIIDKRKEALQAKKSYYDYDKNLRNQNKQISALEAEISAMQNVDDAYTKSLLARKQAELDELKEARDDTIIEHNYEIQSNGLDELQEDLQTKYDEYIDGIGENFESIEGIVSNAKDMFAKSFNAISDSMYSLLQSYGIDPNSTGITWTKITDTQGFATGGIIRSNYTGQDDRILVRVNPDETILTKKFTDMLPSAVEAMKNMNIFQPAMPPLTLPPFNNNTGTSTTNIDTLIRVDGNVDKTVVGDLKELANDLAKKTNLLDKSFKYTTAAMTKDAKSAGHKRTYH